MKKHFLLLLPFFAGFTLLIYSWFLSYPLAVNSVGDSIFNHIPISYWLSIPLLITSMFAIAITFKNRYLNWILAVGFVIVLYSLSYFYYTMPTGDSTFFRGLTQNLITTNNLNASQYIHNYYQWPSFFLLGTITTLVSGLALTNYEFLLFTIIGFLLASSLFVYASKSDKQSGYFVVAAFFVVMFLYLNYQAVPFSLAFALLFVLFILETKERNAATTFAMLILYTSTVITHAFVPLFFVIYLLIHSIISKSRQYFEFFVLTLVIYVVAQITFAVFSFKGNIASIFTPPSEYTGVIGATLASTSIVIDEIPRLLTRTVTVAFALLCIAGFLFMLFKKKLSKMNIAILLTGLIYSGIGALFAVLGLRALPLVFVAVSLGGVVLFQSKFKKYIKYLVAVLLILVVFVPIHSAITNSYPITFQTKEDFTTADLMIEKYNWNSKSIVISDLGARWYIAPQVQGNTEIDTDLQPRYSLTNITRYDSIIYSVGLAQKLNMSNIPVETTAQEIIDKFNVVYNSGYSYIATKSG